MVQVGCHFDQVSLEHRFDHCHLWCAHPLVVVWTKVVVSSFLMSVDRSDRIETDEVQNTSAQIPDRRTSRVPCGFRGSGNLQQHGEEFSSRYECLVGSNHFRGCSRHSTSSVSNVVMADRRRNGLSGIVRSLQRFLFQHSTRNR